MRARRSLAWRLWVGFGGAGLIALALALAGLLALHTVTQSLAALTSNEMEHLVLAERLRRASERKASAIRAYLLSGDEANLVRMDQQRRRFYQLVSKLRQVDSASVETAALLSRAELTERMHQTAFDRARQMLESGASRQEISDLFEHEVQAEHERLDQSLDEFSQLKESRYERARQRATETANSAAAGIIFLTSSGILLLVGLTLMVGRQTLRLFRTEQAATESAKRAVAAREHILAVVSHDLKDPLNAIQIRAALLERNAQNGEAGENLRRAMRSIRHAADRMQYLIRMLLDAASLEAGRMPLDLHPCPVDELVSETADLFDAAAARKSLHLTWRVPEEPVAVLADRERLLQVLSNLVGNSVKFTTSGGSISIRASTTPDDVRFTVADTGSGIPEEYRMRVFERFWTTPQPLGEGTGLGLFIARGIVEAHGGRIWIESQIGRGTVVSFTVPRADLPHRKGDRPRDHSPASIL